MKLVLPFFLLFEFVAHSQFFTPAVEPVVGSNYYNSVEYGNDQIEYQGVSIYYGIKGKLMMGNYLAVYLGGGLKQYPFELDYFLQSTVQATFYRNYKTGFSAFCEVGAEISDWGALSTPFFIGANQYFGKGASFNFRVRIPTFIDVNCLRSADHIEAGIEAGLQFDLLKKKAPKTKFGNPFILN